MAPFSRAPIFIVVVIGVLIAFVTSSNGQSINNNVAPLRSSYYQQQSVGYQPQLPKENYNPLSQKEIQRFAQNVIDEELGLYLNPCDPGWVFNVYSGGCFRFVPEDRRTWFDARTRCRNLNGALASFRDRQELIFLNHLATTAGSPFRAPLRTPAWIGAHSTGGNYWEWDNNDEWGKVDYHLPPLENPEANDTCMAVSYDDLEGAIVRESDPPPGKRLNCLDRLPYVCQKSYIIVPGINDFQLYPQPTLPVPREAERLSRIAIESLSGRNDPRISPDPYWKEYNDALPQPRYNQQQRSYAPPHPRSQSYRKPAPYSANSQSYPAPHPQPYSPKPQPYSPKPQPYTTAPPYAPSKPSYTTSPTYAPTTKKPDYSSTPYTTKRPYSFTTKPPKYQENIPFTPNLQRPQYSTNIPLPNPYTVTPEMVKALARDILRDELAYKWRPCPNGWSYNWVTNACYYSSGNELRTWVEARERCRSLGGNLASFHSRSELLIIEQIGTIGNQVLERGYSAWVGGYWKYGKYVWDDSSFWGDMDDHIHEDLYTIPPEGDNCLAVYNDDAKGAGFIDPYTRIPYDCKSYKMPFVCKMAPVQRGHLQLHPGKPAEVIATVTDYIQNKLDKILFPCEEGWTFYPLNGKCYWSDPGLEFSWYSAEEFCNEMGATLASFQTRLEMQFFNGLCTVGKVTWNTTRETWTYEKSKECWVGASSTFGKPWSWTSGLEWGAGGMVLHLGIEQDPAAMNTCVAVYPDDWFGAGSGDYSEHRAMPEPLPPLSCQRSLLPFLCQKDPMQEVQPTNAPYYPATNSYYY